MDGPSPLEQFQSREDCAEVGEVLLKLEPTYREVLVLRFYEELSLEEIATVTRAPLSTVKSRLYRGLAALKPRDGAACAGRAPVAEARRMKDVFEKTKLEQGRSSRSCDRSALIGDECAGFGGEPDAPGGAGTGEDDGGAA